MTSLRINNKDVAVEEIGLQKSNAFVKFIRKIGCAPSPGSFQTGFPSGGVGPTCVNFGSPALSVSHFASNNISLVGLYHPNFDPADSETVTTDSCSSSNLPIFMGIMTSCLESQASVDSHSVCSACCHGLLVT